MSVGMNQPLTEFGTTKYHPLGYRVQVGANTFRYAYNAGADTLVAGEAIGASQAATVAYGRISGTAADIQDGTSSTAVPLGMAMSAAPTANYVWIQTGGANLVAMVSDGNITQGDKWGLTGTTSPDGTILPIGDGTEENTGGYALADDSGTACAIGSIVIGCDKNW